MAARKKTSRKNKKGKEITSDMMMSDILEKYPETIELFLKHGLHCAGCFASHYETLEGGARAHGLNKESIDKLVKELNEKIKKRK